MRLLRSLLEGEAWSGILANLPGYRPAFAPGKVLVMTAALPWWRFSQPKVRGGAAAPAAALVAG